MNSYKCIQIVQKITETEEIGIEVAIPGKEMEINNRISNKLGIYSVEMMTILTALRWDRKRFLYALNISLSNFIQKLGKISCYSQSSRWQ